MYKNDQYYCKFLFADYLFFIILVPEVFHLYCLNNNNNQWYCENNIRRNMRIITYLMCCLFDDGKKHI